MSERAERAREEGSSLMVGVADEAKGNLDAAVSDQLLAIVGVGGCGEVVERLTERPIRALDGEDLICALDQYRRLLHAPCKEGETIETAIRRTLENMLRQTLTEYLKERGRQFLVAEEQG